MCKELSEMTLEEMWQIFPIKLEAPNETWDAWYKEEESKLKKLFKDKSVRINHIGSTAVKGIWAKPTVDILLETTGGNDFDGIANVLDSNYGCMSRGASRISYQKGYTKYGFSEKVFHLHLRILGDCDEHYFRDYLNDNEKVAKEYEELKLTLWKKFEHDRDAYTNAKGAFISNQTDIAKKLMREDTDLLIVGKINVCVNTKKSYLLFAFHTFSYLLFAYHIEVVKFVSN